MVTAEEMEGFTLEAERKPDKVSKVTIRQIPEALVTLLESQYERALKDPDFELILRVPVRHTPTEAPKNETAEAKATREAADAKAKEEATKKAVSTTKQLALYATAWGKGHEPKLYITKVPNRKDDRESPIARLKVQLDSEVRAENRPGRR